MPGLAWFHSIRNKGCLLACAAASVVSEIEITIAASNSEQEEEERMHMAAEEGTQETQVSDLPEACLAYAIALTSPRDACRCAAVSPSFRAAADSDHVWRRFIPEDHRGCVLPLRLPLRPTTPADPEAASRPPAAAAAKATKKDAYLGLCEDVGVPVDGDGGRRVWLDRASGAKCYALSARRLSLPWDDGEFSWKWTPHPLSRFAEVAELVDCTCLDIYGRLPAAALTPATPYAAYLVYGTAEGQGRSPRGLSYPDQETAVAVGGRVVDRRSVCLWPDEAETRKFRGAGSGPAAGEGGKEEEEPRRPTRKGDGWWEMEMGRLSAASLTGEEEEEVVASFEVLGWYLKRGLIVEGMEFRPVHS